MFHFAGSVSRACLWAAACLVILSFVSTASAAMSAAAVTTRNSSQELDTYTTKYYTVYTNLDREVAIKVLPEALADHSDRLVARND